MGKAEGRRGGGGLSRYRPCRTPGYSPLLVNRYATVYIG